MNMSFTLHELQVIQMLIDSEKKRKHQLEVGTSAEWNFINIAMQVLDKKSYEAIYYAAHAQATKALDTSEGADPMTKPEIKLEQPNPDRVIEAARKWLYPAYIEALEKKIPPVKETA